MRVERAAEASGAAQAAAVRERSAAIAGRKVVPLQRADRRRAAGIAFSDLDIQCTEDLSDGVDDRVRRAVDAGDASPRTCASLPARRQRAGRACLRRCPLPQRGALIGPAYTPHAVLAISPRRSDGDPPDDRVLGSDRSRLGNAHDLPADQVWLRWITVACTTVPGRPATPTPPRPAQPDPAARPARHDPALTAASRGSEGTRVVRSSAPGLLHGRSR